MFALPVVTGAELVAILSRFGWRERRRSAGVVHLEQGGRDLFVPDSSNLSPPVVAALLRTAGVDELAFLRELESKPAA